MFVQIMFLYDIFFFDDFHILILIILFHTKKIQKHQNRKNGQAVLTNSTLFYIILTGLCPLLSRLLFFDFIDKY